MIGEASRSRNPAGRGGLFSNLLALANALATFFETRAALFATESKRALVQLIIVIAGLVGGLLFFALGYLFLVATIVVAIAHATDIALEWVAIAAAVAHFLIAAGCAIFAATRLRRNPFTETAAELKKDREWLRNLDVASRPTR
jgi:uncharacterized membrane protein YqjE